MHHHSSLERFTSVQMFMSRYVDAARGRQEAPNQAFTIHPERFSRGRPLVKLPPQDVAINPIPDNAEPSVAEQGVNFPTLQRLILKAI
jgi:putative transposase